MFSFSLYLSWGSYDSAGDAKVANDTHRLFPLLLFNNFQNVDALPLKRLRTFQRKPTGGMGQKKVSMLSSIFPLQESLTYHNTFDWNQVLLWENESFWPPT